MTKPKNNKINGAKGSVLAKEGDGNIRITLHLPSADVTKVKEQVLTDFQKTTTIAGFRKGKAPIAKLEENIDSAELTQRILTKLLPKAFGDAVIKYKVRPAMYPKFRVLKSSPGEDWEIVALTAEMPDVELGSYKQAVQDALKTTTIWTPDKSKSDQKEPTREEKYNLVATTLLKTCKIKIAQILITEEVEAKLSQLLARLEKLGVSLESYLTSIKKTAEELRKDYEVQAFNSISLDLILNKIASETKVVVDASEVSKIVTAEPGSDTPDRRRLVEQVLKRQKVLDELIAA